MEEIFLIIWHKKIWLIQMDVMLHAHKVVEIVLETVENFALVFVVWKIQWSKLIKDFRDYK
jgi:hypothetical protein